MPSFIALLHQRGEGNEGTCTCVCLTNDHGKIAASIIAVVRLRQRAKRCKWFGVVFYHTIPWKVARMRHFHGGKTTSITLPICFYDGNADNIRTCSTGGRGGL
ncbi:unnamed protein product [Ectocarpus sp. 8 AP-2014]